MCNIEANIEYFAFLNCCNLAFSQIENIIKLLRNFVKEGLKFSLPYLNFTNFLNINLKYCGFFLAQHKHPQKIKTRITCKIFETGYIDTSFQAANRTEI